MMKPFDTTKALASRKDAMFMMRNVEQVGDCDVYLTKWPDRIDAFFKGGSVVADCDWDTREVRFDWGRFEPAAEARIIEAMMNHMRQNPKPSQQDCDAAVARLIANALAGTVAA